MVSKNSRRNRTILLTLGAVFFALSLYSGEIIAALVKSNLLSINIEEISDNVESKNRKMLANRQFEEVTAKLQDVEKLLLDGNQELSKLEMVRKDLQIEKVNHTLQQDDKLVQSQVGKPNFKYVMTQRWIDCMILAHIIQYESIQQLPQQHVHRAAAASTRHRRVAGLVRARSGGGARAR